MANNQQKTVKNIEKSATMLKNLKKTIKNIEKPVKSLQKYRIILKGP